MPSMAANHQAPSLRRRMVEKNSWCLAPANCDFFGNGVEFDITSTLKQRWMVREMFFLQNAVIDTFSKERRGGSFGAVFFVSSPKVQGRKIGMFFL